MSIKRSGDNTPGLFFMFTCPLIFFLCIAKQPTLKTMNIKIITITLMNICCVVGYLLISKSNEIERLDFLVTTFQAEKSLNDSYIDELNSRARSIEQDAYNRGFSDGEIKTGLAFMNDEALNSYSDGYHAAISQFGPVDTSELPSMEVIAVVTLAELFYEYREAGKEKEAYDMRQLLIDELDIGVPVFVDGTKIVQTKKGEFIEVPVNRNPPRNVPKAD